MSTRMSFAVAAIAGCAIITACSKGETKADSAAAADSAAKAAAAATPAPPPPPALTDANILALLDEANAGDSAGGDMASKMGTAASVKSFGRDMMRDHHTLRKAGQDLAKKLNITPAAPANDTLPAAAQKMSDQMKAMAKGADWDKAYIDNEVAVHQSVLALLNSAQTAATDTSLKSAIGTAIPVVQGHLTKAQDIQSKMSAAPAAAPGDSAKKKP